MSSIAVPHPPDQTPEPEFETNPLDELRQRRAMALVPTVRPVPGGFRVSSSCRQIDYLVSQPNGHRVCTCPDYLHHAEEEGFCCKHILGPVRKQVGNWVWVNWVGWCSSTHHGRRGARG